MQKSKIRPKSSQNNNINYNNRNNSTYQKDTKYAESKIISKYLKTGFESLTVEELAVTLISPTFEKTFQETTKTKWPLENKSKAKERLNYAKFNIEWNASQNSKTKFNSGIQFNILFTLAEKGDIQKISEYLNKNYNYKKEIISTVDQNKKSLLHIAAKNGHTQLCKFLIQNGFSVYARDKFLRTPLHLACQFGRDTVADELIKAKSDIFAKDSIGRTALHYAACSDSENLITLLLGINPDLVNARDTYGRTPLHYAVWNGTSKQKEITRKLLMANAEVDAEDEEGMTALHFAADAGKGKVIPILLEFGANPFKKDGRTNRTAIELACNDRIREMIIVYSGKEYKPQIDELKIEGKKMYEEKKENNNDFNQNNNYNDEVNYNNNNSGGRNGGMSNNNSSRFRGGKNKNNNNINNNIHMENGRPSSNPMGNRRISNYNNNNIKNNNNINNNNQNQNELSESMDGEIKNLMFSENKQKLVNQLSNIQNFGIQTMQHLQNPELYSGSWLEKITNANDLYNYLSKLSPQESAIAIFNVLQPYKKSMPQSKGEEQNFKNFFEPKEIKTIREKLNKKKNINNNNIDDEGNFINNQNEINNLNNNNNFDSDIYNTNSVNTKKEIDELREEIKKLNEKIIDNKKESENQEYLKIKEELEKYQTENQQLKEQTKEYSNQIKILTNDVKKFENETKELQKKENEKKDKIIEDLTTKLNLLNTEYENTKNKKFSLKSNNPKIFQNFINNNLNNNNDLNINDEENIYVFLKLCDSQGGLYNLLLKFDYDNDNFLLKNEFNNLLDNLNLNMGYRNSVLKLSGFDNNFKLSVKNIFSKFYNNRNNKNNILNNTLFNIVYKLNDSKKDFDQFVNCLYNISENNYINKKTFNEAIIRENLLITDEDLNNIYSNWSYDNKRNEADLNIETEELCKLLKSRKDIIDQIGNMSNNIKFGKNFDNNNNFNKNNNSNIYKTGNSNVYKNNNNVNTSQYNNNNMSYSKFNNVINNNESQNINTINNNLNKGSTITMKNYDNENAEEVEEEEEEENNEMKKIPEITNINEKIGNLYNSKIDDNKNITNNKDTSTIIDITNNINTKSNLNNNNSTIKDNTSINNNNNITNTNSKRKTLFNPDEIINGELKVQVKHIIDLKLPKSIQNPFTFSLTSILEGINEEPNSKEITVDNLKEIKFNWSIRFILKKITLKNLSSNCKIILNFGKTIVGVTSFNWTKCLNKKNYDKYVINDYFQVLNKKNVEIGKICIYAKFIPFGFKTSNFDKNGKKRKIKRNINDIVGEDSQDSYSTVKSQKNVVNNSNIISSKIKSNNSLNEEVEEEHKENEEVEEEEKEINDDKVDEKSKEKVDEKSEDKMDVKSEEKVDDENNNNIENKNNEINGSNNNQEDEEYNDKFEEDIPEQFENNDDDDNKKIENGSSKLSMNNNNNNISESGETLIKEIDCEVTNILDKDNINDKYYLIVNYKNNNEDITCYNSKNDSNFLKEIKATPFTFNFMIYTNSKEKDFNFNINIIDDENNGEIVSQININLENNKKVFTVNDRYNLTGKENITLFMKFNVNTQGNEDEKE